MDYGVFKARLCLFSIILVFVITTVVCYYSERTLVYDRKLLLFKKVPTH